jgi:hypothetical protein
MSYGKLNYEALQEEFCVEYFTLYGKYPAKSAVFSKENLIKQIHKLKRSHHKIRSHKK